MNIEQVSGWKRTTALAVLVFVMGVGVGRLFPGASQTPLSRVLGASPTTTGNVLGQGQSPRMDLSQDVDFAQFWEVWQKVRNTYYQQPVADKDLFYGALSGLVAGAGDPYTVFFPPKEAEEFSQQLDGKFEGIGAQIDAKQGILTVVAPLPSSPAEKAGLRSGDLIAKIDGKPTEGLTVDQAAERIRGPKGSAVTLEVIRQGSRSVPFALTIVRDEIQVKSVTLAWKPGNLALLTITGFNNDTPSLFEEARQQIVQKQAKGIILDLRSNPGGSVLSAQDVAGAWVGDQVIFKQRRQGKIVDSIRGIGRGELGSIPTIVLVNGGSASASEIVAGALEDYGKAVLVGTKTFGKGSEQEYQGLKDGSALKITIAEWVTPKERTINHIGLEPTIVVERTDADYDAKRDPQLDRAQQLLRNGGATAPALPAHATGTTVQP